MQRNALSRNLIQFMLHKSDNVSPHLFWSNQMARKVSVTRPLESAHESTWTGDGGDHQFGDATNWSDGVPGKITVAMFTGDVGNVDISDGETVKVRALSLSGSMTLVGGNLELDGRAGTDLRVFKGSDLTIGRDAAFSMVSPFGFVDGKLVDEGVLTLNNTSIAGKLLATGADSHLGGSATLTGDASATITSGAFFAGYLTLTDGSAASFSQDAPGLNGTVFLEESASCTVANGQLGEANIGGASSFLATGNTDMGQVELSDESTALLTGGGTISAYQIYDMAGDSGSPEILINDGTTLDTNGLILSEGSAIVEGAGTVLSGGVVYVGGSLSVLNGGQVSIGTNTLEVAGGVVSLEAGSDITAGTLSCAGGSVIAVGSDGGGTATISGTLEQSSTVTTFSSQDGGTLVLSGADMYGFMHVGGGAVMLTNSDLAGAATILGGTLEIGAAACAGPTAQGYFTFGDAAATLRFDANPGTLNFVSNFLEHSVIDLAGFAFSKGLVETVSNGQTLQLSSNGDTVSLRFASIASGEFHFVSDGHGGTDILHAGAGQ